MSKFLYKIYLTPLWLITLLPLPLLYGFSSFVYFLIYYVAGYRRKVVYSNLHNSFPEKSNNEIKQIARKFYKHFCDFFLESIYVINMSSREINRRYRYTNLELLEQLYKKQKSIILIAGHYCNWEWLINLPIVSDYNLYGIYRPLSNKFFDQLFINIRSKYGAIPVIMQQTLRVILECQKKNERAVTFFLGDQRPGMESLHYWTDFLNQDTPVITGMERIARKTNQSVVFMEVQKPKRGFYDVTFHLLYENPANTKEFEIAEIQIRKLESIIKARPEFWLWTHKRWKFKRNN